MFLFFLVLNHDFIRCVYFTRSAASNTESDNVTNYVTQKILNKDLLYTYAHFVVEIHKKI